MSCAHCANSIPARRDWDKPPKYCKRCKDSYPAREISCKDCGGTINLSTGRQLKCAANGWNLPERCEQCKHDSLLIKGAIGAARDQFNFAIEVQIEKRGILFTDKVAVVRSRRTGEKVAEITMNEKGLFFTERVAVTTDLRTGRKVAETRDDRKGIIFQERVARTFDAKSGERTHETTREKRGIIWQEHYARTENLKTKEVSETTTHKKGFLWPSKIFNTVKKK